MPTSEQAIIERLASADVPVMGIDEDTVHARGRRIARRRRRTGFALAASGVLLAGAGFLALGPDGPLAGEDPVPPADVGVSDLPDAEDGFADVQGRTSAPVEGEPESLVLARTDGALTTTFTGGDASGEPVEPTEGPAGSLVYQDGPATLITWEQRYDDGGYPVFDLGDPSRSPFALVRFQGVLNLGEQSYGAWYLPQVPDGVSLRDVALRSQDGTITTTSGAPVETTQVEVAGATVVVASSGADGVLGLCPEQDVCSFGGAETIVPSYLGAASAPEDASWYAVAQVPDGATDIEVALRSSGGELPAEVTPVELDGRQYVLGSHPNSEEVAEAIALDQEGYVVRWVGADGEPGQVELALDLPEPVTSR